MTHVSPSKGKAREATRSTELGWWDVFPLTETPKRPVQWSLSSVMFMGAAAQPLILGRNFSNSKQFPLPSPTAIASAPTHYLPPTCLLVSPNEEFVFAFFPGREVAGVGCIWMRGYTNDMWGVLKTWAFAKGAGVVGGQWLGGPRQWAFGPAESLIRLPPQGPRMPAADSVLLLITEDHQVHLKYSRPENTPRAQGYPQFQTSLQASLERPNYVIETRGASDTEPIPKPVSDFLCFDIAIGVHFSEPRIFIAHRSRCINSSNLETPSFDMSMDMKNGAICPPDWELVGQESMIHVSAIDLRMKDTLVVMEVTPLSPITNVPRYVTQMSFMSFPSEEAKTGTDKVEVALDNFFLSVSSFDMKNYDTAALKSTLDLYRLRRVPSADKESPSIWQLHNSTVVDGALAFVAPATQPQTVSEGIAFVGVLDVMGKPSKAQTRKNETSVGNIRVLNIPSLTENSRWEPTPIWSSAVAHGLPHAGSISPNHKFIWEPSFSIWYLQTSIETLPQRLRGESKYSPNAISLALAIQSRKAVSDIIQVIARPTVPIQEAVVCVQQALNLLRAVPMGAQFPVICELVGISLELYKTRGALSKNESEKADMEARWKVAQDMASLAVARVAFEDCSIEGYGYEESAIWSLNKLTQSILEFVKELMKACVLAATLAGPPSPTDDDDDLFGGGEASESPSWNPPSALLHFCYPFALENFTVLVMHIKRFRNYMASLQPPQDEVARHVLNDMIDYCPVDMAELETFLKATAEGLRKLDVESLDEGFAACKPTASLTPYLRSICEKIIEHPTLLDKARLFVEPYDLLDGVARMSEGHKLKGKDIDIVTKQSLHNKTQWLCIRCEGRRRSAFQSPAGPSPKWKAWEKKFRTRCICGGAWSQR
ncbi:hypothetical protein BKA70DRAFT_1247385 [Coprinopsis sp. MPI-PUGE-AT-0042]|nr:hypothetical protein BKA70DRAFT_1247385 [Coprinopsis sp. MPI-PUGE-AT-0042]